MNAWEFDERVENSRFFPAAPSTSQVAKICEAVTRVNGALRLDPDRTPNPTGRGAGAGRKTEATAHCYYSYGMAGGKERGTNACSPAAHWPDGSLIRRAHDPKVVLDWPSTWRLKAVTPGQFQPQRKVEYPRAKSITRVNSVNSSYS